jgi:[ribosomal protein S5]-alanine N-acetyltransferase
MIVLETERLYLRELTSNDAEEMYHLNLDDDVTKYTGDIAFESIAAAKSFLESYDHYKKYGFGRWAVIRKSDEQFLGWCGLKYTAELDEFDLGFRFFKKYWNNGYATESAKACIELGFTKFKMPTIIGRVRKENLASIIVLKKIGLTYFKPFDFRGNEGFIYKIDV